MNIGYIHPIKRHSILFSIYIDTDEFGHCIDKKTKSATALFWEDIEKIEYERGKTTFIYKVL